MTNNTQKFIDYFKNLILCSIDLTNKSISLEGKAKLLKIAATTQLKEASQLVYNELTLHQDNEDIIIAATTADHPEIENFLIEALAKPATPHRDLITRLLANKKKFSLLSLMTSLIADKDRNVRYQAAQGLYNIGTRQASLALCKYLADPDEWISLTCLKLLCKMREKDSISFLIENYNNQLDVRKKAILVSHLSKSHYVPLVGLYYDGLNSKDARLKANCIEAIGNLNLPEAETKERIEQFLHDPNNRTKANAILVLAKYNPEKLKPEIEAMATSKDVQLKRSAAYILSVVRSDYMEDIAPKLLADNNVDVRKRMVISLSNFNEEYVVTHLQTALSDNDSWVRKYALDVASQTPSFPPAKILSMLKTEKMAPNIAAAINYFITHPSEEALPYLKLHIKDSRLIVVNALIKAITAIKKEQAIDWLSSKVDKKNPEILKMLAETALEYANLSILDDLANTLSYAKTDAQISIVAPAIEGCLKLLNNPARHSKSLATALESVLIPDIPQKAPKEPENHDVADNKENTEKIPDLLPETDEELNEGIPDEGYFYMGMIHYRENRHSEAKECFEKYLKFAPNHAKANYLLGCMYHKLQDWEQLINLYTKYVTGEITMMPTMQKHIHQSLGIAYIKTHNYEKGFKLLSALFAESQDNPDYAYYMAFAQHHMQESEKALALLNSIQDKIEKNTNLKRLVDELKEKITLSL